METTKTLTRLENQYDYFDYLLSVQSDPYYYIGLIIPVEQRINRLNKIIAEIKNQKNLSGEQKQQKEKVLKLLQQYQLLRKKYFQNYPFSNQ